MEETEATLNSVMTAEVTDKKSHDTTTVKDYIEATLAGANILTAEKFSDKFFNRIHSVLMANSKKPDVKIGQYRDNQNCIRRHDSDYSIIYMPPAPDYVQTLMSDLIGFMNSGTCYHELIAAAIIHGQFLTIHPYGDGNGRLGRILVPLYLYQKKIINTPFLFFSEALEKDKALYYRKLSLMRDGDWNGWVVFFLDCISRQCQKYINLITGIDKLYEKELITVKNIIKGQNYVEIVNLLFKGMIINKDSLIKIGISSASANRYLNILFENNVVSTDVGKTRNKLYYYDALLSLLTQ